MITHLSKETGQQKEQWGWGLEVTGNWGEGDGQNLKKKGGGGGNIGGGSSKNRAVSIHLSTM